MAKKKKEERTESPAQVLPSPGLVTIRDRKSGLTIPIIIPPTTEAPAAASERPYMQPGLGSAMWNREPNREPIDALSLLRKPMPEPATEQSRTALAAASQWSGERGKKSSDGPSIPQILGGIPVAIGAALTSPWAPVVGGAASTIFGGPSAGYDFLTGYYRYQDREPEEKMTPFEWRLLTNMAMMDDPETSFLAFDELARKTGNDLYRRFGETKKYDAEKFEKIMGSLGKAFGAQNQEHALEIVGNNFSQLAKQFDKPWVRDLV
ncbi:MAG: hypothetical protein GF355_09535, partial [Candidatus Eisenbacteria bacterium]|nr:hypothetical protein [Candidatus Eisenbacteria bacterium]